MYKNKMGVLDTIMQMKGQGLPNDEIISQLREQGFSPREINDALSQSEIKRAVSNMPEGMEPPTPEVSEKRYSPQIKEISEQEVYAPQQQAQEYYQQAGEYAQYQQQGAGTDTIIEIAEQVFEDKSKKMHKTIDELNDFKSSSQTKIENSLERLKRIEAIIDKLQISILERIGSYGSNLESIKKEMSMMQDSFGKMVGRVAEKHERQEEPKEHKKKK